MAPPPSKEVGFNTRQLGIQLGHILPPETANANDELLDTMQSHLDRMRQMNRSARENWEREQLESHIRMGELARQRLAQMNNPSTNSYPPLQASSATQSYPQVFNGPEYPTHQASVGSTATIHEIATSPSPILSAHPPSYSNLSTIHHQSNHPDDYQGNVFARPPNQAAPNPTWNIQRPSASHLNEAAQSPLPQRYNTQAFPDSGQTFSQMNDSTRKHQRGVPPQRPIGVASYQQGALHASSPSVSSSHSHINQNALAPGGDGNSYQTSHRPSYTQALPSLFVSTVPSSENGHFQQQPPPQVVSSEVSEPAPPSTVAFPLGRDDATGSIDLMPSVDRLPNGATANNGAQGTIIQPPIQSGSLLNRSKVFGGATVPPLSKPTRPEDTFPPFRHSVHPTMKKKTPVLLPTSAKAQLPTAVQPSRIPIQDTPSVTASQYQPYSETFKTRPHIISTNSGNVPISAVPSTAQILIGQNIPSTTTPASANKSTLAYDIRRALGTSNGKKRRWENGEFNINGHPVTQQDAATGLQIGEVTPSSAKATPNIAPATPDIAPATRVLDSTDHNRIHPTIQQPARRSSILTEVLPSTERTLQLSEKPPRPTEEPLFLPSPTSSTFSSPEETPLRRKRKRSAITQPSLASGPFDHPRDNLRKIASKRMEVFVLVPPAPEWVKRMGLRKEQKQAEIEQQDSEQRVEIQTVYSRLGEWWCRWQGCGALFSSGLRLSNHLDSHLNEDRNTDYQCRWNVCTVQCKNASELRQHLEMQALRPLPCKYEACGVECQRGSDLLRHYREHTPNDPIKRDFRPMRGALDQVDEALAQDLTIYPSFMSVPRRVIGTPISAERHQRIGPWVLRNIFQLVNLSTPRYNVTRAPPLYASATFATTHDEYDFLLEDPEPPHARQLPFASISSTEVTEQFVRGLTLWGDVPIDEETVDSPSLE